MVIFIDANEINSYEYSDCAEIGYAYDVSHIFSAILLLAVSFTVFTI